MRFNQYSFIKKEDSIYLQELASLGFHLNPNASNKENLETFVRKCHFLTSNTDLPLSNMIADWETDLLTFFRSEREVTDQIFYHVAFQLLGFVPNFPLGL